MDHYIILHSVINFGYFYLEISRHGYRSPIVALLKSRSRKVITDTCDKTAEQGCQKHPAKKCQNSGKIIKGNLRKQTVKESPRQIKKRVHSPENGIIAAGWESNESHSLSLENKGSSETSQFVESAADPATVQNREGTGCDGSSQHKDNLSNKSSASSVSVGVCANGNEPNKAFPSGDFPVSQLSECNVRKGVSEHTKADSSSAICESSCGSSEKHVSPEGMPSHLVILKQFQPVLPSGGDGEQPRNIECPVDGNGQEMVIKELKREYLESDPAPVPGE